MAIMSNRVVVFEWKIKRNETTEEMEWNEMKWKDMDDSGSNSHDGSAL